MGSFKGSRILREDVEGGMDSDSCGGFEEGSSAILDIDRAVISIMGFFD